ncbi:hypothetical protein [uncultured Roseibium sp.]|uniref:hypothetical protein n=1 Tax=uncultured Roseibium sp. TaxID=1936171 RepID=UPI0026066137|nr:hypothetical protein [uncultured Roseibium sp.]
MQQQTATFQNTLAKCWPWSVNGATGAHEQRFLDAEAARCALAKLGSLYSADQLSAIVCAYLMNICIEQAAGRPLSERDSETTTACLTLLAASKAIAIPSAQLERIVATFNPGYWYQAVAPLIAQRLTRASLCAALVKSLSKEREPDDLYFALQGVRIYSTATAGLPPGSGHTPLVHALTRRVRELADNHDDEIATAARNASTFLKNYE